jgi:hypothetical protein
MEKSVIIYNNLSGEEFSKVGEALALHLTNIRVI